MGLPPSDNFAFVSGLAQIQEAIEKLSAQDRAALREWLDGYDPEDPETMAAIRERVRQIRTGEATLIDGEEVQREMRELAHGMARK
jgi:hypothetical protein